MKEIMKFKLAINSNYTSSLLKPWLNYIEIYYMDFCFYVRAMTKFNTRNYTWLSKNLKDGNK